MFPYKLSFDLVGKKNKKGVEFEFNLNQVHLLLISSNYMMKHGRLHSNGHSENYGCYSSPLKKISS
jgi:hypothetical protein